MKLTKTQLAALKALAVTNGAPLGVQQDGRAVVLDFQGQELWTGKMITLERLWYAGLLEMHTVRNEMQSFGISQAGLERVKNEL